MVTQATVDTTIPDGVQAPTLSTRLREETHAEHERAEHRSFISLLMDGELTMDDYIEYVAQYAYVYDALEARVAQAGEPAFLSDPRLHRAAAIRADLAALGVTDLEAQHPPLPATLAYVARIQAADAAHIYLGHHYTRYLGDLSGGQIIGTKVARLYGATPEQLNFYRFDDIEKPVIYKRAYREAVDALDLTDEQADELIAEAKAAFAANSELFDELGKRALARA